jgi:hypothetical protein
MNMNQTIIATAAFLAVAGLAPSFSTAPEVAAEPRPCGEWCIEKSKIWGNDPYREQSLQRGLDRLSVQLSAVSLSDPKFTETIGEIATYAVQNEEIAPKAMEILEARARKIVEEGGKASSGIQSRKANAVQSLYGARQEIAVRMNIHHEWAQYLLPREKETGPAYLRKGDRPVPGIPSPIDEPGIPQPVL